jgi:hypothetical protein
VEIHLVTDGPAKGWSHTHGLAAHGRPELEIRGVPLFLGSATARLLNDLADYLLNDAQAPLLAGQIIHGGRSALQVVAAHPDPDGGYDPAHYVDVRLLIVDAPDTGCACEECARELANRPALDN